MIAFIAFLVYLLIDKGMDMWYSAHQLKAQVDLQKSQPQVTEEPEQERRQIGFNQFPASLMEVEEDDG